ncbi:MAG: DUF3696 domain-containing protein [Lachnospiraceae bacterium]|nr:DUF3696 domain-containing protein [Lachnospiraceae bacterium]
MIDEIRLKNFKCFPELVLPMSELTILTGANAAGKSSIIQAMLLTFATMEEKGQSIDAGQALNVEIGNPRTLMAQNPIRLQGMDAYFDFSIKLNQGFLFQKSETTDFIIGMKQGNKETNIHYKINKLSPLKLLFDCRKNEISGSLSYLNAERVGPRISYPAKNEDKILSNGANAAFLIDRADFLDRPVSENLLLKENEEDGKKFSIQVERWMGAILGNVELLVNTDLTKATTDVRYGNPLAEEAVAPTMTGFGISYILPIVTAGLWCSSLDDSILIIENPEAHLHPAAQSQMGKFLYLVSTAGVQVIVETHSEHIIDGARIQAALMRQTDRVSVKFLSEREKKITIEEIGIREDGELEKWPEGFFDQKTQDLRELFQMRRKHAGS